MRIALMVICGFIFCFPVNAEKIQLKSGEVYQGQIVDQNDSYVAISTGGAPVYLAQDQISQIINEVKPSEPVKNDPKLEAALEPKSDDEERPVSSDNPALYTSKDLKCSFKIPDGFTIAEDSDNRIVLGNKDRTIDLIVLHIVLSEPITEERIKVLGVQMVAKSLNHDVNDLEGLGKIVKLFGDRVVSGKKAYWFYYPEVKNEYLIYRAFLASNDQTGYMIQFNIYSQNNDQYVDQGAKLANAFLDDFKI